MTRDLHFVLSVGLAAQLAACGGQVVVTPETCGNGRRDAGEACDGADLGGQTCLGLGFGPGTLACTADCRLYTSGCSALLTHCGDGHLEAGEECDGTDLGGQSCIGLGHSGGQLDCDSDCTFDLAGCVVCGDGVAEGTEQCDGPDLRDHDCLALGFDGGSLGCLACRYDRRGCLGCGNQRVEAGEDCDGTDLAGQDCAGLGYEGGVLACDLACAYDRGGCFACGNGLRESGEDCDGTDFGGQTCADFGYDGGVLDCSSDCGRVESGCRTCGNGLREAGEDCDGTDLGGADCRGLGMDGGSLGCVACAYDLAACTGCGNGVREAGEECDGSDFDGLGCGDLGHDSGWLDCGTDCRISEAACGDCGNGRLEAGEDCDGTDLGGATCATLLFDGGALACDGACAFTTAACVDCPPGGLWCPGAGCVEPLGDPAHCGGCDPCEAGQVCSGGACHAASVAWQLVGGGPLAGPGQLESHDLVASAGAPLVVWSDYESMSYGAFAARLDGPAWSALPAIRQTTAFDGPRVVASAVDADGTIWAAWAGGTHRHAGWLDGTTWREVGAPGLAVRCMMAMSLQLAVQAGQPHLVTRGAGGCGTSVDYGTFDGTTWLPPQPDFGSPYLAFDSPGAPDIALGQRVWIGYSRTAWPLVEHRVVYQDLAGSTEFLAAGGPLDVSAEPTGGGEDLSLATAGDGGLYAAWVEDTSTDASSAPQVWVKRLVADWELVGPGAASAPSVTASAPSLALIGPTPWLAYLRDDGGTTRVAVAAYDGASWVQVGGLLDPAPAPASHGPVIAGVAGVPHVAYRRGAFGSQELVVVRLPE